MGIIRAGFESLNLVESQDTRVKPEYEVGTLLS